MILGIDTSCYTTSVAVCDEQGRLLCEKRRLLPVSQGECGLRQSDGLFAHTKQLPQMVEDLYAQIDDLQLSRNLKAVAVSARPRPVEDSYMPVFLAGCAVARSLAVAMRVPLFETSHQEGHLAAALYSADLPHKDQAFLAFHLSGGTGELLRVTPRKDGFDVELIGDTDLPPGQFVDRVGVALGMPFPAGVHLEKLAEQAASCDFRLSGSVKGTHISFSGPESAAQRAIAQGVSGEQIAAAVLDNIAKSLTKAIKAGRELSGIKPVLLMGGVASNKRIRRHLKMPGVYFAAPELSSDNACGVALLGQKMWTLSMRDE